MPEQYLQRNVSVMQSASHSRHLSICESGGTEGESDLTQNWLRSV